MPLLQCCPAGVHLSTGGSEISSIRTEVSSDRLVSNAPFSHLLWSDLKRFRSLELIIIRYFILNSLFLYTTAMIYSTMCACIECLGLHWDPNVNQSTSMHQYTTIGLAVTLVALLVYFLFDRCVYEKEFRSIWTPYLFVGYIFICPPLRQLSLLETNGVTDPTNYYLLWIIFGVCLLMVIVRLGRQLSMRCGKMRKKIRISSHIEQITSGTDVH